MWDKSSWKSYNWPWTKCCSEASYKTQLSPSRSYQSYRTRHNRLDHRAPDHEHLVQLSVLYRRSRCSAYSSVLYRSAPLYPSWSLVFILVSGRTQSCLPDCWCRMQQLWSRPSHPEGMYRNQGLHGSALCWEHEACQCPSEFLYLRVAL